MTDELDALSRTRSAASAPSAEVRRAARARWDHELAAVALESAPRRSHGGRTFALRTAIAGVTAVAIVAGVLFVTRTRIDSVKPSHVVAVGSLGEGGATDPQVFLLVGSDARDFTAGGQDAPRADTIVLVRVEPKSGTSLMVSVPRDLAVEIPGHGTDKINAAFALGGMPLLVETIRDNLGVPINHALEVRFPQFAALVDELGGLRVRFPTPARDTYTGLSEPAGCVTLSGSEALSFVRSRHYEYLDQGRWLFDARSDLGRIDRQQLALRQLATAAESRVSVDPRPQLRALFAHVTVDTGFTSDDALRLFSALRGNDSVESETLPVRSDQASDGQEVLRLVPAAQSLIDALTGRKSMASATPGDASGAGPRVSPPTVATAC